jgi:hypothetical protein
VDGGCTLAERNAIWAKMDTQPFVPPKSAALLPLMGTPGYVVSRAKAESILCVGAFLGDRFDDGDRVEVWGQAQEVELDYDATGAGHFLRIYPGYTGAFDFYSDPDSKLDPPGSVAVIGPAGRRQNHYHGSSARSF